MTNSSTSKKNEQEKFNEYSINTDDAWEIDDRTITLKLLDNENNNNNGSDNNYPSHIFGISKEVRSNKYLNKIHRILF